jgi:signal transduction histidine kinase
MTAVSLVEWLRGLVKHDAVLAAALGATLFVACLAADYGLPQALGGAVLCAPLAWRSRRPTWVLTAVAIGSVADLWWGHAGPYYVGPLAVALYASAIHGTRGRTLAVGASLVPYSVALVVLFSRDNRSTLAQILELLSQLGFALAIGEAVRSSRALIGALRQRAEQAELTAEVDAQRRVYAERVHIAREVHDIVAHSLASISTQAGIGVHLSRRNNDRAVEVLGSIKDISTEALDDLRHALGALRDDDSSVPVVPASSMRDLRGLVDRARESGLPVVLRLEGSQTAVPAPVQATVFRIVQEGLTNVMRHAQGAHATVRVAVRRRGVEVDVTNEGGGRATASSAITPGSGLIGMRERAAALGGAFEAGRISGGGFHVHVVLPLDEPLA